ncbi:hypothetical protein O3W44_00010 [Pantoea sp. LMR881]|uniref:hypothetical protein n=1 Tax=Pantoea sp. LMR881 TaxID=3014336 RepID=UPI0022B00F2C|nr:hypothetical protein [Pantoea sp. LMR881]MCZ4057796.1 hypothetical protein [Pantoea sp. LMR881]
MKTLVHHIPFLFGDLSGPDISSDHYVLIGPDQMQVRRRLRKVRVSVRTILDYVQQNPISDPLRRQSPCMGGIPSAIPAEA